MDTTKPYTFDRVVRIIIGVIVVFFVFFLINRLSGVLLPFLVAWLIAYLLQPFVSFFQYKLKFKNRILSIVCTFLLLFIFIAAFLIIITPLVSNEFEKIIKLINLYTQGLKVDSFIPIAWQNEIRNYLLQLDLQSILKDENLMLAVKKITPQLWNVFNGTLSIFWGLTVIIIVFLYLIFILVDYEKITAGMFKIIPLKYRPLISDIVNDLEVGMNSYFRGQALVALIVGFLFAIGFSIIGLPLAIVFGLFIGVLNLVPYLQTFSVIPALFLAYLQSIETGQTYGSVLLWIAIVYIIVQSTQDIFLVPKIMGKVTGMKPAVILLSLSIWGSLMGMVGLIIALPISTLIISYYKRFVLHETKNEGLELDDTLNV